MLSHHDLLAFLPDINESGMGHEYDRDKPPYEVFPRVFTERWYLLQGDGMWLQMGLYMGLVALQVEALVRGQSHGNCQPLRQCVQCIQESGYGIKGDRPGLDCTRTVLGQHLPHPFPQLALVLPRLGHLYPEVLGVEDQAIEQEQRHSLRTAVAAPVAPDLKHNPAVAGSAPLESDGRVKMVSAARASTSAFGSHCQTTRTLRALMAGEHDLVEELPDTLAETGRSNVLLIIGDDQGWTDFGFTGHPVVRTVASGSAGVAGRGVPECLRDVPAVSADPDATVLTTG
jgi:hypothetical protein